MFDIHLVESWQCIADQMQLWHQLHKQIAPDNPFISPLWSKIWFESERKSDKKVLLLVSRDKDAEGLLLLAKGRTHRYGIPMVSIESIGVAKSARGRHLVCEQEPLLKKEAIDSFLACISGIKYWTFCRLAPVQGSHALVSEIVKAAPRHGLTVLRRNYSVGYKVNGLISWEEFEQTRSRKFLKNIRKLYLEFRDSDEFEIKSYSAIAEVDYLLSVIEMVSARSWKKKAGSDIFNSSFNGFYRNLFMQTIMTGKTTLYVLEYLGKPIGYEWHLREGDRVLALKADYDQNFAHCSPGNILAWHALKESFAKGMSEVDYLMGGGDYKKRWTTNSYQLEEVLLFNSNSYSQFIYRILLRQESIDSLLDTCRRIKQKMASIHFRFTSLKAFD
jgi:CelD/BcsL family acetyltransferase involved in cellulose biosynthesis